MITLKIRHLNETVSIDRENCSGKVTVKDLNSLFETELKTKVELDLVWLVLSELETWQEFFFIPQVRKAEVSRPKQASQIQNTTKIQPFITTFTSLPRTTIILMISLLSVNSLILSSAKAAFSKSSLDASAGT